MIKSKNKSKTLQNPKQLLFYFSSKIKNQNTQSFYFINIYVKGINEFPSAISDCCQAWNT